MVALLKKIAWGTASLLSLVGLLWLYNLSIGGPISSDELQARKHVREEAIKFAAFYAAIADICAAKPGNKSENTAVWGRQKEAFIATGEHLISSAPVVNRARQQFEAFFRDQRLEPERVWDDAIGCGVALLEEMNKAQSRLERQAAAMR